MQRSFANYSVVSWTIKRKTRRMAIIFILAKVYLYIIMLASPKFVVVLSIPVLLKIKIITI